MTRVEQALAVATMLAKRKTNVPKMLVTHDNSRMEQAYEIGLLRGLIRSLSIARSGIEIQTILEHEMHHMQVQMQLKEKLDGNLQNS